MRYSANLPKEGTPWTADKIFSALGAEKHDELPEGKLVFLGQSGYAQKPSFWEDANGNCWQV